MYKGKYFLGDMSTRNADALLNLLNNVDKVYNLKNSIRNLPKHTVQDIIADKELYYKENGTLDGFVKSYKNVVGELRDEQTVGVAYMYLAGSCLMGDEVGLGKTVQCAGLVNLLENECKKQGKPFRYCFLTEKTSINQIRNKMVQFTGRYVGMLESGELKCVKKYMKQYDSGFEYSVVGGHSLLNSSEFLIHTAKHPFDLIIIDESSVLKNTTSDIFKNCKALFKFHKKKVLLNATPLEQNALEFFNQLNLLDDKFMPSMVDFKKRYCIMKQGAFGYNEISGYKNAEEFKTAISLRYIARTRKTQGAVYEGNRQKIVYVPLSPEQKQLLKKTSLYAMVHDYPPAVNRDIEFSVKTTPKAGALLYVLDNIDVVNEKALIYCRYLDCQSSLKVLLEEKGYRVAQLNGSTKSKDRAQIVDNFTSGLYDILITNVQRGLDLNNCDNCIMYTIDPNPQKMVQFEGRITRDFDVKYKSVFLLVSEGKEKKFVEETLKMRVNASKAFSIQGSSMTVAALNDEAGIEKEVYRG